MRKNNKLTLAKQEASLKRVFPNSLVIRKREESLMWKHSITPSPLSDTYIVKLTYNTKEGVKVFVTNPKPLLLAKGKTALPHVYSTSEQRLCLYYPKGREWTPGMLYVKTLIPWTCEWLFHYECWVATGIWNGGGIHNETAAERLTSRQKRSIVKQRVKKSKIHRMKKK